MLKANDFDTDGCRTFIVQFPCRNMKTFSFLESFRKKVTSNETLTLIWVSFSGVCFEVRGGRGKNTPCLKLIRVMLET